jgi:outer membrane receptor for ferrienterochelin and colicins
MYLEFVDINHNILGNPNLRPETSNHFQLWYTVTDSIKRNKLVLDVNPFYQYIDDKISLAQSGDGTLYSYFNIDEFHSMGIQSTVTVSREQLKVKGGFSYLGIATNYTANKFYYTPEFAGSVDYSLRKLPLGFNLFYKYTGVVSSFYQNEDQSLEQIFIDDYHLLDIQGHYKFWKKRVQLAIGVRNLLDVKNINSMGGSGAHSGGSSTPIGVGRSYYTTLIFNLNSTK